MSRERKSSPLPRILAGLPVVFVCSALSQQAVDPEFVPSIDVPEYESGQGPRVLIDAAHLNHDTADGSYLPLAELLRADGYTVESNRVRFSGDGTGRLHRPLSRPGGTLTRVSNS